MLRKRQAVPEVPPKDCGPEYEVPRVGFVKDIRECYCSRMRRSAESALLHL
jgi:hypothetical protein